MQRTAATDAAPALAIGAELPESGPLAAALSRHDAVAAAALYAPDALLLTTGEHIIGRAQIEAYWRTGITLGLTRVVLTPTELRVGEHVAVEAGRYELSVAGVPGVPGATDRGTYVVLHRRDGSGTWLRVVDLFDVDPATPPGLDLLEGK